MIATTPQPPYYAVIFTNIHTKTIEEYEETAQLMSELAKKQPGFLGMESARDTVGITISYWKDLESIKQWKQNSEHQIAQQKGRDHFYISYKVRIALVEKDYKFDKRVE